MIDRRPASRTPRTQPTGAVSSDDEPARMKLREGVPGRCRADVLDVGMKTGGETGRDCGKLTEGDHVRSLHR